MPPEALFRALADGTRLRCLMLLLREGELCVCELTEALALSQPKISRHLAHLRDAGITDVRREGTWVFYRVAGTLPGWARAVLEATFDGNAENSTFTSDLARLERMAGRPPRGCCA
ncbi:MAG: metalloregulator ArsR/SmtB family transcription factor [Guyparkeria sp.]|uniref:metalloregulator ArsR/SmtB family transcription factor n=1 Tax=Guyparkeria sp. TaxID=2035736 RepID=UPI00397E60DB